MTAPQIHFNVAETSLGITFTLSSTSQGKSAFATVSAVPVGHIFGPEAV